MLDDRFTGTSSIDVSIHTWASFRLISAMNDDGGSTGVRSSGGRKHHPSAALAAVCLM